MKTIKKIVTTYLQIVMISVVIVVLVTMLIAQILGTQRRAQEVAAERFDQIEQILAENEQDLVEVEEVMEQYRLRNAEIVAFMIERHDDLPENTDRMREIAALLGLTEIWIFDETGRAYAGTDERYFGITMDDGEQIGFFKPMLEDKSLRLCQDAMPRSSDGKMTQYSAIWSRDGSCIVQVGNDAESALQMTEKYELSAILSMLRVFSNAELYAISMESGEILGSTVTEDVGKNLTEIGLDMDTVQAKRKGLHARVNGVNSYGIFAEVDDYLLGRVVPNKVLYQDIPVKAIELTLILFMVAAVLIIAISKHLERFVIRDIRKVNEKLRAITDGNLDERVEQNSTKEFFELGEHINRMVESLSEKLSNEYQYQAELTEALKLADAANRSKSSFLFSMSHDVRTPMNAILGFTSMAEKHIDDKERVMDCLKKVNSAGDHLLRLVNDVLDMARIDSGKLEFKVDAHSVSESVSTTEAIFAQEMQKKNINFSVSCDVKDDIAFYDTLRMEQVELNLISNALKYTPAGGSVSYTVTQTERTDDGYAIYQGVVKDTGVGMAEEFCRRVFEPFEREHTSTVNGIPGTGLGLTITKRIIEQMGGTISCNSKLGVGSEFIFTVKFKIGTPDDLQDKSPNEASKAKFSRKRILLVEDNELNREIAYEILVDYGFRVETAEDGLIAVDMVSHAAAGYYDLILMDIQMPNMDGYQATEVIRRLDDPGLANIPIVAFTANAFDEDRNKAYGVGMNGHLAKPINVTKLIDTLTYFL